MIFSLLSEKETTPRSFPGFLKRGRPNLMLVPRGRLFLCSLAWANLRLVNVLNYVFRGKHLGLKKNHIVEVLQFNTLFIGINLNVMLCEYFNKLSKYVPI